MNERPTTAPHPSPGEHGAAAVEFALLLPLLLLVVFGIIQFGRAYNAKIELTGAVREGARAAALGKTDDEVRAVVRAATPGLALADEDITVAGCGAGAENASVTGTFDMGYVIPFLSSSSWGGMWNLSATGVMRCGL